jgi:hypothetical protein
VSQGEDELKDVEPEALPDLSILNGMKVNKLGKIVNEEVRFTLPKTSYFRPLFT